MKKSLKKAYIEEAIKDCKGDLKKMWRLIKTRWPSKGKSTVIGKMLNDTDPSRIADTLNSHFATAGLKVNQTTNPVNIMQRTYPDQTDRPQLSEMSPQDIGKLLQKLSPAKATGSDGISARMVKACRESII